MFVSAKQAVRHRHHLSRLKAESVDHQTTTTVSAAWLYSASRGIGLLHGPVSALLN